MKIVLVSLFMVEYGVELANALSRKHSVHLVLCQNRVSETFGDQFRNKLAPNVIPVILPFRSPFRPSTGRCVASVIKLLMTVRPQIIHVQECMNPLNFVFWLFSSCPFIVTVHDVEPHPGVQQDTVSKKALFFIKLVRERVYNDVIVHGKALKKLFLNKYNKAPSQVHTIAHGPLFSFDPGATRAVTEEPKTILFFGRMQKYKGLKYLIKTEPLASKEVKGLKIIVAGRGEEMDKYKEQMIYNPNFEVHDRFIPNAEVATFFQRSAVVVMPYIEASQSGISAIALAFKKPVITTDVGSLGEMVINGRIGIIVPPRDINALSAAIIEMLTEKELKLRMKKNILHTLKNDFNWDRIADATLDVYASLIKTKKRLGKNHG